MSRTVAIRWHGRGGQGAKTAALLLADACAEVGAYVQGFPEYGPERMGAPITAYNRISDKPIRLHSNIYEPDYVVVVDEGLIGKVDVAAGLADDGAIIVNTSRSEEEIRTALKGFNGRVCVIDADEISLKTLGKKIPNTPLLAEVVKVTGLIDLNVFERNMQESFKHKFASKPHVVEGNMAAIREVLKR